MRLLASLAMMIAFVSGAVQAQNAPLVAPASKVAAGRIIQQERIAVPGGAAAYRVLYWSTDPMGAPIAVSGMVIVPQGVPPPGGRPIVAWAHPTSGVVPKCAPSLAHFFFRQVQGLQDMLDRGYIVAATDYPGLGTPGPHPYLIGVSEARAVIDSVRAARTLPGVAAGGSFAVWGHSQGGQAALFTGLVARSYAPELRLVGVAAAAPATDLTRLLADDINTDGGRNLTAMTLYSWSRLYNLSLAGVIDPRAVPVVDTLSSECIENVFDVLERQITQRPLQQVFLSNPSFAGAEPWRSLLLRNSPGPLPSGLPVFLAQGSADRLVRPDVTQAYFRELCRVSPVRYLIMPGVGHAEAAKRSASEAVLWISDRFEGHAPPSDC